ncbi:sugar transporter [Purpureocillium lavendulum]|uniref:Sugar transporter n=1 Tax=Purpureocillium lavendulum TaxID=1247861 RepID=A0AB34FP38_9HYPO|nr:sugar transporter [Purpureocillium lavendulum]
MLRKTPTGTWLPAWVPESTATISVLLMACSIIQSATGGFDGSLLNGLNILPSYTDYFRLTPATTGLNTASVFIGGFFGPMIAGLMCDRLGRRPTLLWGSVIVLIGIILQSTAQNVAMFVVARVILGFGNGISGVAAPVYLSETSPSRWRAWTVGLVNNFYYVGALIAAGVTLGTGTWQSTWAWRAPSFMQAIFSIICIAILPLCPESPRWLVRQDRYEDARLVVAQTNANGDLTDPVVMATYKEIVDSLDWEKKEGRTLSVKELVKSRTSRKRVLIGGSAGPFSCIAGNIIASYYLGQELDTAGITDSNDQLKANVVLNVWCLFCCLAGTQMASSWGRKPTALLSQGLLIVCLFIIGGLSKTYAENPDGTSKSLIYGDVAVMFLFQGFYSIAWTPLLTLYPPEVMDYPIRANGVAFAQYSLNGLACLLVFVMPIALTNIGWKTYMINGSWNIITFVLIAVFWVETKGKTLEEIDAIFDETKHSMVPNVEDIRTGKRTIDVGEIEQQLHEEIGLKAE